MPVGMAGSLVYQTRQVAPRGPLARHDNPKFYGCALDFPPGGTGRQGKVMASTIGNAESEALAAGEGVRRRDFINIAAVSAAGVGGLATLVPLISQMAPLKDVLAELTTELDISAIEP